MKTKLLFMLLLCSFYCVSCSNDVKTDAKENAVVEANYAKLNETLDLYSQNFVASHPTSVATRGRFWNWFKAVLFCDASGAALGGIVGGGGGALIGGILFSACAGSCAYVVPRPPLSDQMEMAIVTEVPCLSLKDDSVGFLHNSIISEIAEENEGVFEDNLTTEEWMNLIFPKAEKYGCSVSESDKNTIISKMNEMPLSSELVQNDEQLVEYYKMKMPERAQQLDIIKTYVSTASQIMCKDDLQEYTEGCTRIISETQLPVEEQKALASSVIVAENSALLWVESDEAITLKP